MSGFGEDKNPFNMNNKMTKKERANAAYDLSKSGYDEDRKRFIQEEISDKKKQIKEKMLNNESEQSIKEFITWEFNCINTYKKNRKIHRSGIQNKIVGTKDVAYNNSPTQTEVNKIYNEIKSSIPKPLSSDEQYFQDLQKSLKAQQHAQEAAMYYDSCDSDDNVDHAAQFDEDDRRQKERDAIWDSEYEERCRIAEDQKKCDDRKEEIKQLHENDLGIKRSCDTKRKAQLKNRMRDNMGKKRVADVPKDNMTEEEVKKVIPTLEMGDDIEEFKEGEVTKYKVIKKSETTELNHDWRLMWNIYQDYSRIKYYNPTFKLEIFEKPIKGIPKYDNEHIRNNLKKAYEEENDENKIIVWNPVREQGMVDIYDPKKDIGGPKKEDEYKPDMRMGWDDTKGNDRPYYVYNIGYKSTPTYEPPMDKLSSASFEGKRGVYTNENENKKEAGPKDPRLGGKRKTRKQKKAGKAKKTKKASKKRTQKKGKKQRKQKR